MATPTTTLGELFPWWPKDTADDLRELTTFDSQGLNAALEESGVDEDVRFVVRILRSMGLDIKNSAEREDPLSSPEAVAKALGTTLSPPKGRWITYSLDASRRRISLPHKTSGSRFVCRITKLFPEATDLSPLPEGGVYLVIWRGLPDVLNEKGVMKRIAKLQSPSTPLADVVIYERSENLNEGSCVYSLRRRQGARGMVAVPLNLSDEVAKKASTLWQ
jgi:hypothetical protein